MSIFNHGKNIKLYNKNIPIFSDINMLNSLEPAKIGTEALVVSGSDKIYFVRDKNKWKVPALNNIDINYINDNTIPRYPKSNIRNEEIFGKNLAIQGNSYVMGDLFGGTSACTTSVMYKNKSNRTISSVRIIMNSIANNNACTYYAKIARKGNGTETNPEYSWQYVTWNGIDNITPTSGNSRESPYIMMSDDIIIPSTIPPNDYLVIWVSMDGGANKLITFLEDNYNQYNPSLIFGGNFGYGNFAISSSSSSSWIGSNYGNPMSHIIFKYTDEQKISNIITIGDSTFAEVVPLTMPYGEGWCSNVSDMFRTSGIPYRVISFGQGTFTMEQSYKRFLSIEKSGILNHVNVVMMQAWSWNSSSDNVDDFESRMYELVWIKDICDKHDVDFFTIIIAPPGQGKNSDVIKFYNYTKSYLQNYGIKCIDIHSVVSNGDNWNAEDSLDNVHGNAGSSSNVIGQYKQALELSSQLPQIMIDRGY